MIFYISYRQVSKDKPQLTFFQKGWSVDAIYNLLKGEEGKNSANCRHYIFSSNHGYVTPVNLIKVVKFRRRIFSGNHGYVNLINGSKIS